jgi:large subunit ribosomal protein L22
VRINGSKLQAAMENAGVSVEQLAQALVGPGMPQKDAERALTNWLVDRDHPRCKAPAIRKIAGTLGVRIADIAAFRSQVRGHKGSARKAKLLTDLIRGKDVVTAENLLRFTNKRAALNIARALKAAVTDAEAADANVSTLVVSESRVDAGPVMKRFNQKDRGRSHQILKPFSHITVGVEEKQVGGKKRK